MKNIFLLLILISTSVFSQKIIHDKPVQLSNIPTELNFSQLFVIGPGNVISKAPRSIFASDLQSVIDNGSTYSGNADIDIDTSRDIFTRGYNVKLQTLPETFISLIPEEIFIESFILNFDAINMYFNASNTIDFNFDQKFRVGFSGDYGNLGDVLVNQGGYLEYEPKAGREITIVPTGTPYTVVSDDYTLIWSGDSILVLDPASASNNKRMIRIVLENPATLSVDYIDYTGNATNVLQRGVTLLHSNGVNWYKVN